LTFAFVGFFVGFSVVVMVDMDVMLVHCVALD